MCSHCSRHRNENSRHQTYSNLSFPHLLNFSKEVTIIINEEQPDLAASFHVPESLLTEKSEFLQAACRNEWKEASSRIIKLPDVEPDISSLYLFWVHRDKLALHNDWDPDGDDCEENALTVQTRLVKLWILADRLSDVRLCNIVIDEMVGATEKSDSTGLFVLFPPDLTVLIWSATTAGRSIRRMVIDYYITYVCVEGVEKNMYEHHPDFLKELMLAALHVVDNISPHGLIPAEKTEKSGCYYHDHVEEIPEQDCLQDK